MRLHFALAFAILGAAVEALPVADTNVSILSLVVVVVVVVDSNTMSPPQIPKTNNPTRPTSLNPSISKTHSPTTPPSRSAN